MKINELPHYLENELAYPVDRTIVIERIGHVEVDAPAREGTATIATTLERLNEQAYSCPEELFNAIVGTLGDEYIGRKFYDDRGPNPEAPAGGTEFPANESF